MNILIIGSNGFIGSNLYIHFKNNSNYKVWGCDIYSNSSDDNYVEIDSLNPNFEEVFSSVNFDCCVNASGFANVNASITQPHLDFKLNTHNVFLILNAIRLHTPTCKFINLSSAAVYGNPQYLPISESHPIAPVSPYGWHKYQSELLCREFYEVYAIPTCSIRIFSAYGAGLKKQLLWDLYNKIKSDPTISLFGTGKESRDFIYIDDIVFAIELIIKKTAFKADVFNIGNGIEVTTKEIADLIIKGLASAKELTFSGTVRKGDPINWCADISKLKALGFKPTTTIQVGINKYIKWLKEEKLA